MKKITLLLIGFSVITTYCKSQEKEILKFDRRFVHCINKWVAFSYDKKDGSFAYGYVYPSSSQGISLRFMGRINYSNGHFLPNNKPDSLGAMMTYRLTPDYKNKIVGIIPNERFKEISVEEFPEEYKFYRDDTISVSGLYNRGFLFNAWDECKDALNYLTKANKINPNYQGLAVELAYSYNGLKQYDKAAEILKDALTHSPNNCYFYKELAFTYTHSNKLNEAEDVVQKALTICNDDLTKCEMACNLAATFYDLKNINLEKSGLPKQKNTQQIINK